MHHAAEKRTGTGPDEPNRRDVLKVGATLALGRGPARPKIPVPGEPPTSCILILLVGGPSHVDTWDMKPDAPSEFRGPFRPIATNVPGIAVSEVFPRMARVMDRVALVRGVHHQAVPVHDLGHQLMQTGRLATGPTEPPHFGSVLARVAGTSGDLPPHVILNGPIGPTGGNTSHGQTAGSLGEAFEPRFLDDEEARRAFRIVDEPGPARERYGRSRFGRDCLLARGLVEAGVRFVTINMYRTVFREPTWDCHGAHPFSPLEAYRTRVGPDFDAGYSTLIEDLDARGRLGSTMVVALGEFGRAPRINAAGGRDHHPGCSTALFAGGPFRGGRVVGSSDAIGHEPTDRPVTPAEIAATLYDGLGLDLDTELDGPDGCPIRVVDPGVRPIRELT